MRLNNVIKYDGNYTPKEEGFYLLCLFNNTYAIGYGNTSRPISINNDCYIDGIRENDVNKDRKHQNDIVDDSKPFISIFDHYEAIPVIGKYQDGVMKDYLTGKLVRYKDITSKDMSDYGLSYYAAFKIPNQIVFKVVDLLNSDDIYKYRKAVNLMDEMAIINANDTRLVNKRKTRGHK